MKFYSQVIPSPVTRDAIRTLLPRIGRSLELSAFTAHTNMCTAMKYAITDLSGQHVTLREFCFEEGKDERW
jgi:hypothetical protein